MRRFLICSAAALALTGTACAAGTAPSLRFTQSSPPVVAGARFHHGERVKVTFHVAGTTQVRWTRATSAGRFVVSAPAVAADRCGDLMLASAKGATGDLATAKLMLPECPPAP